MGAWLHGMCCAGARFSATRTPGRVWAVPSRASCWPPVHASVPAPAARGRSCIFVGAWLYGMCAAGARAVSRALSGTRRGAEAVPYCAPCSLLLHASEPLAPARASSAFNVIGSDRPYPHHVRVHSMRLYSAVEARGSRACIVQLVNEGVYQDLNISATEHPLIFQILVRWFWRLRCWRQRCLAAWL